MISGSKTYDINLNPKSDVAVVVGSRPSDYVYVKLATEVYEENNEDLPEGWIKYATFDNKDSNGYYGAAYLNEQLNHIIVVHCGTKLEMNDLVADIEGVYLNRWNVQQQSALQFSNQIKLEAESLHCQISFAGHSLGAWLSELMTYHFVYHKNYYTWSVTIDSPGSYEKISKLSSSSQHSAMILQALDFTTYLSYPNIVNTCNTHIGTVFRVYPNIDFDFKTKFLLHNFKTHSSKGILACFTQEDHLPQDYTKILKWPRGLWQYTKFYDYVTYKDNLRPPNAHANFPVAMKISEKAHYEEDTASTEQLKQTLSLRHFHPTIRSFLQSFCRLNESVKQSVIDNVSKDYCVEGNIFNCLKGYKILNDLKDSYREILIVDKSLNKNTPRMNAYEFREEMINLFRGRPFLMQGFRLLIQNYLKNRPNFASINFTNGPLVEDEQTLIKKIQSVMKSQYLNTNHSHALSLDKLYQNYVIRNTNLNLQEIDENHSTKTLDGLLLQICHEKNIILTGDPGIGKSTFLESLCYSLNLTDTNKQNQPAIDFVWRINFKNIPSRNIALSEIIYQNFFSDEDVYIDFRIFSQAWNSIMNSNLKQLFVLDNVATLNDVSKYRCFKEILTQKNGCHIISTNRAEQTDTPFGSYITYKLLGLGEGVEASLKEVLDKQFLDFSVDSEILRNPTVQKKLLDVSRKTDAPSMTAYYESIIESLLENYAQQTHRHTNALIRELAKAAYELELNDKEKLIPEDLKLMPYLSNWVMNSIALFKKSGELDYVFTNNQVKLYFLAYHLYVLKLDKTNTKAQTALRERLKKVVDVSAYKNIFIFFTGMLAKSTAIERVEEDLLTLFKSCFTDSNDVFKLYALELVILMMQEAIARLPRKNPEFFRQCFQVLSQHAAFWLIHFFNSPMHQTSSLAATLAHAKDVFNEIIFPYFYVWILDMSQAPTALTLDIVRAERILRFLAQSKMSLKPHVLSSIERFTRPMFREQTRVLAYEILAQSGYSFNFEDILKLFEIETARPLAIALMSRNSNNEAKEVGHDLDKRLAQRFWSIVKKVSASRTQIDFRTKQLLSTYMHLFMHLHKPELLVITQDFGALFNLYLRDAQLMENFLMCVSIADDTIQLSILQKCLIQFEKFNEESLIEYQGLIRFLALAPSIFFQPTEILHEGILKQITRLLCSTNEHCKYAITFLIYILSHQNEGFIQALNQYKPEKETIHLEIPVLTKLFLDALLFNITPFQHELAILALKHSALATFPENLFDTELPKGVHYGVIKLLSLSERKFTNQEAISQFLNQFLQQELDGIARAKDPGVLDIFFQAVQQSGIMLDKTGIEQLTLQTHKFDGLTQINIWKWKWILGFTNKVESLFEIGCILNEANMEETYVDKLLQPFGNLCSQDKSLLFKKIKTQLTQDMNAQDKSKAPALLHGLIKALQFIHRFDITTPLDIFKILVNHGNKTLQPLEDVQILFGLYEASEAKSENNLFILLGTVLYPNLKQTQNYRKELEHHFLSDIIEMQNEKTGLFTVRQSIILFFSNQFINESTQRLNITFLEALLKLHNQTKEGFLKSHIKNRVFECFVKHNLSPVVLSEMFNNNNVNLDKAFIDSFLTYYIAPEALCYLPTSKQDKVKYWFKKIKNDSSNEFGPVFNQANQRGFNHWTQEAHQMIGPLNLNLGLNTKEILNKDTNKILQAILTYTLDHASGFDVIKSTLNGLKTDKRVIVNMPLNDKDLELTSLQLHKGTLLHFVCQGANLIKERLGGEYNPFSMLKAKQLKAIEERCLEILLYFYELNADVNATDVYHQTPLFYIVSSARSVIMLKSFLNKCRPDLSESMLYDCEGESVLTALVGGQFNVIELFQIAMQSKLHEYINDLSGVRNSPILTILAKDYNEVKLGRASMFTAAKTPNQVLLAIALREGGQANQIGFQKESILFVKEQCPNEKYYALVLYMLSNFSSHLRLNAQDFRGNTPLHNYLQHLFELMIKVPEELAVYKPHIENVKKIIEWLINKSNGKDLMLQNGEGKRCLDMIRENSNEALKPYLLDLDKKLLKKTRGYQTSPHDLDEQERALCIKTFLEKNHMLIQQYQSIEIMSLSYLDSAMLDTSARTLEKPMQDWLDEFQTVYSKVYRMLLMLDKHALAQFNPTQAINKHMPVLERYIKRLTSRTRYLYTALNLLDDILKQKTELRTGAFGPEEKQYRTELIEHDINQINQWRAYFKETAAMGYTTGVYSFKARLEVQYEQESIVLNYCKNLLGAIQDCFKYTYYYNEFQALGEDKLREICEEITSISPTNMIHINNNNTVSTRPTAQFWFRTNVTPLTEQQRPFHNHAVQVNYQAIDWDNNNSTIAPMTFFSKSKPGPEKVSRSPDKADVNNNTSPNY